MNHSEYTLDQVRHSASHVLAMAAARVFPNVKIGVGPVTKEGFYYDFEFDTPITWDNVKRIESEMNLIIQEDLPFKQLSVPRDVAYQVLLTRGQVYKAELLKGIPDADISFFETGDEFLDLCRGPHVRSTGDIGAIKLTTLSDSHWMGDPERPRLQRISGVAFRNLDEFREYMRVQEEVEQRDFRKLAKDLNLQIGGTRNTIYTGKGTTVIQILENTIINQYSSDFTEIKVPSYRNFQELEQAIDQMFSYKNRSYRELPKGYITASRLELNKPIQLIEEREISSVNAVVTKSYFEKNQISNQINVHLENIVTTFVNLDIKISAEISVPNQGLVYLEPAANLFTRKAISQRQIVDATIPHNQMIIKIIAKDEFNREWVMLETSIGVSTTEYVTRTGDILQPLYISSIWILEKILAYYLEQTDGNLPIWMAPIQAAVIPITDDQHDYATLVSKLLQKQHIRVEVDDRSETMQSRIRDAELRRIPAIIVVGEKEQATDTASLRLRNREEVGLISNTELAERLFQS